MGIKSYFVHLKLTRCYKSTILQKKKKKKERKKERKKGVPFHGTVEKKMIMGSIPGLAQQVKDLALLWLWCRPTAVGSPSWTPSMGTSICCGSGPKK